VNGLESKGERLIREILEKEGVFFTQEYSFPELKSFKHKPLRYDFAIFENKQVSALIEWQGEQHYAFVEHFSKTKGKWDYAREMDVQKCKFALLNKIPLYCIPYYEYDNIKTIEDIFSEKYLVKSKWHNLQVGRNKN
jgi:hypothetical protein